MAEERQKRLTQRMEELIGDIGELNKLKSSMRSDAFLPTPPQAAQGPGVLDKIQGGMERAGGLLKSIPIAGDILQNLAPPPRDSQAERLASAERIAGVGAEQKTAEQMMRDLAALQRTHVSGGYDVESARVGAAGRATSAKATDLTNTIKILDNAMTPDAEAAARKKLVDAGLLSPAEAADPGVNIWDRLFNFLGVAKGKATRALEGVGGEKSTGGTDTRPPLGSFNK